MCRINQKFLTFLLGQAWAHQSDFTTRNNYYGVQYPTKVKVVSNANPSEMQVWDNLDLDSEGIEGWYVPNILNEYGQTSRILQNIFKKEENVFRAAFKRDTSNGQANSIVNGKVLRSKTLELELQNDSTEETPLLEIKIFSTLSEITNK